MKQQASPKRTKQKRLSPDDHFATKRPPNTSHVDI